MSQRVRVRRRGAFEPARARAGGTSAGGAGAPALAVLCAALVGAGAALAGPQTEPARPPQVSPTPTPTATTAPPTAATLWTVSGTRAGDPATVAFAPATGGLSLAGTVTPLAEVVLIRFPEHRIVTQPVRLLLRGGEELAVTLRDGDEDRVVFESLVLARSGADTTTLSVPIDSVLAIAFPDQFPSAGRFRQFRNELPGGRRSSQIPAQPVAPAGKDDNDVVLTLEGSRLTGLLERVLARAIDFEADTLGRVTLDHDKIRAVTISALEEDETDLAPAIGPQVGVTFQDGSYLVGALLTLGADGLTMRSRSLGEVRAQLDHVRFVEVRGGRSVFLSDLEPEAVELAETLFSPHPVQRDANVLGGPLKIRGELFRKGLGMHAPTRLRYRLGGEYERFQAIIGMDDEARPTSVEAETYGGGTALFRVLLDGVVALEKELSYRDPPLPIDIPVAGKTTLTIEVDAGTGFIILDRADWADARLVRGSSS